MRVLLLLAICVITHSASAQVGLPRDDGADRRFQVDFTAGAWFPRLEGKTTLGSNGTPLTMGDLDLDTSQVAFNGEGSISWDRCRVTVGGYDFTVSGSSVLGGPARIGGNLAPAGSTIDSEVHAWSVSTEFAYDLLTPFEEKMFPWSNPKAKVTNLTADGRRVLDFRFSLHGGVRLINLEQTYRIRGGGTAGSNNAWLSPYLGVGMDLDWVTRGSVPLVDHVVFSVHAGAGPAFSGGSYTMAIRAGVTIYLTRRLGVTLGYRLSDWSLAREDNAFEEGGLQGLFAGVSYTW